MNEVEVNRGIIEGHRMLIFERYDYDRISSNYSIPDFFTLEKAEEFRNYFMEYVYPDSTKREELDEAFGQLDDYIKSPEKLLSILKDSVSLIFKYGRHLPKILSAGLKAMKSFRSATDLELLLVSEALQSNSTPPYNSDEMKEFLSKIKNVKLHSHMESFWPLYDILLDNELVEKILEVVDSLIAKMEKRPRIYQTEEVEGIKVGREVINKGAQLFNQFTRVQLTELVTTIKQIEKDAYAEFMT